MDVQSSVGIYNDLKAVLPRAAELLGCNPQNLQILFYDAQPMNYMKSKFRDICVSQLGPVEGCPFVVTGRKHSRRPMGYGLIKYQSRQDKELQYCVYVMPGEFGDDRFLIIPDKKVFRFVRNAHRNDRRATSKNKPPILEEGQLEEILGNTLGFLTQAKKLESFGCRVKRGVILDGLPGNGKTMACRYIQKLCTRRGIRWGVITASQIDRAYNDGNLDALFQQYTVSFFDDIDISYLNRKSGNGKLACSLLTAMDGMTNSSHLVRIFTTNEKVDDLDPAFNRPGRIDKVITLNKPNDILRRRLVTEVWPKSITDNLDIELLVKRSDGMSFAELEAIRTFLVTNYLTSDLGWDLDAAFDDFEGRKDDEVENKALGFGVAPKKKKKKRNRGGRI